MSEQKRTVIKSDRMSHELLNMMRSKTDITDVERCIKLGADVNAKSYHGFTPLMLAVRADRTDIAEILLKNGADVNAKNPNGKTPLMMTVGALRTEMAKLLLEWGGDPKIEDNWGKSALSLVNKRRSAHARPFVEAFKASMDNQKNGTKKATAKQATTLIEDKTPLSAQQRNTLKTELNFLKSLLKSEEVGIDSETRTVSLQDQVDFFKRTLTQEEINQGLLTSVTRDHASGVRYCLALGANINAPIGIGRTALMEAASFGKSEALEALLLHNPDIDQIDSSGHTALMLASRAGKPEIVSKLMQSGADLSTKNYYGHTALTLAIRSNIPVTTLATLLTHKKPEDQKSIDNALLYAVEKRKPEAVKILLEHGAQTHVRNLDGQTPLILAIRSGKPETVKVLLESKTPHIDTQDTDKQTALMVAVKEYRVEEVRMLLKAGADPNIKNAKGQTAMEQFKAGNLKAWADGIPRESRIEIRQMLSTAQDSNKEVLKDVVDQKQSKEELALKVVRHSLDEGDHSPKGAGIGGIFNQGYEAQQPEIGSDASYGSGRF